MLAIPVAVLGGALFLGSALPTASTIAQAGFGGHGHRGHWGHGGSDDHTEHAEMAVEWVLRWVDGSDEQRDQITQIVTDSMQELGELREQHRTQRESLIAEMSKPEIDRAAIEELRRDSLAMADDASARVVSALADVADVLSVEQRRELIEVAERFHRH
jgi:Spy/CpxP family protein refolding chaperone